jgi:hypothetical protein
VQRIVLALGLVGVLACSKENAKPAPLPEAPVTSSSSSSSAAPSIGVARMLADGTLELDLRGPGGAEARLVYPPTHAKYKETLAHLGGMKPGEEKPVPPWPDPWDASKVEAAAHAHAAKKGWKKGEYTVEITGTDADGNAAVTLHHADDAHAKVPGGGKSVALRIETKGYTVVRELGFQ